MLKLSEAQVKLAVTQYLQFQQNLGKLMFLRLNSGEIIAMAGESRRRIKLCDSGTADFVVFQAEEITASIRLPQIPCLACRVTFLEIKSSKGKRTPEQVEFERKVKCQNCRYYVVRDAGELEGILDR